MFHQDFYTHCGRGRRPKFAAYDFETDGLGGPVVAISYIMEGEKNATYLAGGSERDLLQRLLDVMCHNNNFTWFAHNAQYEFRYFIDYLLDNRDHVHFFLRTDSDIFMIVIDLPDYGEKARLVLRDSFAIWDLSLEKIGATFCPDLPKLKLDFEKERFDPKNPHHIEYAKRDSETLLLSLIRFNEILLDNFDVNVATTRSSTALMAWQRTLGVGECYYNDKANEDFVRSAYYGGLVFLTNTRRFENTRTFDINSSYPFQMISCLMPHGNSIRTRLYSNGHLGIYHCTLVAPDDLVVPIIPKRDSKGIVWPRGTFETTVTNIELEFAVRHGYRLLQIHDGRIWHSTCQPFMDFISRCIEIRSTNETGSTLDWTAKYMQNGLYGKFGSKRKRRKILTTIEDNDTDDFEFWGDFFIKTETAEDMQCLPQWSVFITANARLHLLRTVYAIGPENVLYGDTDSITVREGISLPTGKNYGQWKEEKNWRDFRAHGPKVYAGRLMSGELRGAAKGIPRRTWERKDEAGNVIWSVFRSILEADDNAVVRYKTLEKFVTAMKTRYNGEHEAERSLSQLGHSRTWQELPDGRVRPRYWHEIEARERGSLPAARGGDTPERGSVATA